MRCAIMGAVSDPGATASGREGSASLEESALLRKRFAQGLEDYTYLSRDD